MTITRQNKTTTTTRSNVVVVVFFFFFFFSLETTNIGWVCRHCRRRCGMRESQIGSSRD